MKEIVFIVNKRVSISSLYCAYAHILAGKSSPGGSITTPKVTVEIIVDTKLNMPLISSNLPLLCCKTLFTRFKLQNFSFGFIVLDGGTSMIDEDGG
ncbi:hypothetical protein VIGAN_06011600 [Vigna angularis var. angularis]|uniref:Uncharacterized protein n=1 Tax=Vigna angularis var. angularis TaxID=157739 RepID=A0A0S3S8P8_PHAAN|nr:hypothetical protein VIGAN_06011600 [Vigna angularis var. angularis]